VLVVASGPAPENILGSGGGQVVGRLVNQP
jgi:hypothetical protein